MPNMPVKHGTGYRVKWRMPGSRRQENFTVRGLGSDRENKDAANALYMWLASRNDCVSDKDPAIQQYGFLRPDKPLHEVPQQVPAFGDLGREMVDLKSHIQVGTRKSRYAMIRNHFGDWDKVPVNEITPHMVAAKAAELKAKAGGAGHSYVNYMSFARSVFTFAVTEKHLDESPTRNLVLLGVEDRPLDIMDPVEFATLLAAAVCTQTRDMMILMIQTGMRISEVHALRCGDFLDLGNDDARIWVRRAVKYREGSGDGVRTEGLPKNKKTRRIFLDAVTAAYFAKLIDGRASDDYVFPAPGGKGGWYYSRWRLTRWAPTVAAAIKAGFDNQRIQIRPHGLRHTHASWMLADGMDIRVLSERLGHSDPAFTLRIYTHVTKQGRAIGRALLAKRAALLPLAA